MLFSIIVPIYKVENYLNQCVDSILGQTFQDFEIILVDDGSPDACPAICDEYAKKDSRIKVVHKENGGLSDARNAGIAVASGEYFIFIDSDDYIQPEMYEALYEAAVKHDADLVVSGISFVGGNIFSQPEDYIEKHCFEKDTVFEDEGIKQLLLGIIGASPKEPEDSRYGVSVCKNIFKRSLLCEENIKFFSERQIISEDTLFMVDYVKHVKKAVGIHGAFYCYRRNDASLSKSYRSDRFEKVMIFFAALEEHLREILPEDEYRLYLDRLIQGYGRVLCSQEIMHAHDEKITYRLLRARLRQVCTHETMARVLQSYPWYQLPKKQAAFAFAMKHRLYRLQKIMVLLRAR